MFKWWRRVFPAVFHLNIGLQYRSGETEMNTALAILALLGERAPALTVDAIKTYADIAHGEGGIHKVRATLADLLQLVDHAISSITPPTA